MTRPVLIIDDDADVRDAIGQTLALHGFEPHVASSFVVAKDKITRSFEGVVLTDIRMPGRDGYHVLEYTRAIDADLPVVLLTGEADVPKAVQAMQMGAFGFLEKPCPADVLTETLGKAQAHRTTALKLRAHKAEQETGDAASRMLFGVSAQSERMRDQVRRVAAARGDVLITGEAGSGTSKVAEVVHLLSAGSGAPFVKRVCGGLDPLALHEAIQAAKGGTLFLDEIWALPPSLQSVLADCREDVRLILAAVRDLRGLVMEGQFNGELFYRVDPLTIVIPPLRSRKEDIPVLFSHYLDQACEHGGLARPDVPPHVFVQLMADDWEGNARALQSAAMRYALGVSDLASGGEMGLADQMVQVERSLLDQALKRHLGRASDVAKALKLPRKTLYDKLAKHGLRPEDYRKE
ncbi:sigma-54 dependent transcriptional regulator [Nereida sp. MMG025]|uniref:sigma-54-dependent transcriptional regulator n=1 Tax=Nereida sp. MMG025 TaxID=2909981 RepID=UPI001F2995D4|nr:sigma-54 dependent transcriptional regulator [Nereida sp. MMG025]MCF6445371.1 sigma-54 dependent transcriptional regulator [Nereida sp. MMG025]